MNNLPVILIEVVLIFGSVLAFSIWQLRSIKSRTRLRRRKKRHLHRAHRGIRKGNKTFTRLLSKRSKERLSCTLSIAAPPSSVRIRLRV